MYFALAAAAWAAVVVAAFHGDAATRTAVPPTTTAARIRPAMRADCPRMRFPSSLVSVGKGEVDRLALAPDDERVVRRVGEAHVVDPSNDRLTRHAGPARAGQGVEQLVGAHGLGLPGVVALAEVDGERADLVQPDLGLRPEADAPQLLGVPADQGLLQRHVLVLLERDHVGVRVDGPHARPVDGLAAVQVTQVLVVDGQVSEVFGPVAAEVPGDVGAGRAAVMDHDPHLRGQRRAAVDVAGVGRAVGGVEPAAVLHVEVLWELGRPDLARALELRLAPRRDDADPGQTVRAQRADRSRRAAVGRDEGLDCGRVGVQGRDHDPVAGGVVVVGLERDLRSDALGAQGLEPVVEARLLDRERLAVRRGWVVGGDVPGRAEPDRVHAESGPVRAVHGRDRVLRRVVRCRAGVAAVDPAVLTADRAGDRGGRGGRRGWGPGRPDGLAELPERAGPARAGRSWPAGPRWPARPGPRRGARAHAIGPGR